MHKRVGSSAGGEVVACQVQNRVGSSAGGEVVACQVQNRVGSSAGGEVMACQLEVMVGWQDSAGRFHVPALLVCCVCADPSPPVLYRNERSIIRRRAESIPIGHD